MDDIEAMGLKKRFLKLKSNSFVRSAGVLMSGTAAGQLVTVLALPVLTRIYSPEEFSLLAVYTATLTLLVVIACLRLEIAVPLPESDTEGADLLAAALFATTAIAAFTWLIVSHFGSHIFLALGQPEIQSYGWLLPIGVWLAGCYAALQAWATRKERFSAIAQTRLMQAGSGASVQIGLGWMGFGAIGLMIGHALMGGAGVLSLAWKSVRADNTIFRAISIQGVARVLKAYRRFPQYSTLEALANNAAIQVPLLLIAALAVGPEAGFVMLAMRALGTPVALLGNAVAQVYLSRAPSEMRAGKLSEFTAEALTGLAKVGVAPLIILSVIAPSLFSFVFGEEWRRAGELVVWMTPWFILKLLSSPVAMVMHVRMMQRAMLLLMLLGLLIRIGLTLLAFKVDSRFVSEAYAVSGAVHYFVALVVYMKVAGVRGQTIWIMVKSRLSCFIGLIAMISAFFLLKHGTALGLI